MSKLGLPLPSAGGDGGSGGDCSGEVSLQSGRMKPASAHRREHECARAQIVLRIQKGLAATRGMGVETVWDVSAAQREEKAAQDSILRRVTHSPQV